MLRGVEEGVMLGMWRLGKTMAERERRAWVTRRDTAAVGVDPELDFAGVGGKDEGSLWVLVEG